MMTLTLLTTTDMTTSRGMAIDRHGQAGASDLQPWSQGTKSALARKGRFLLLRQSSYILECDAQMLVASNWCELNNYPLHGLV
jgi:hypothetical protein